VADKTTHAPFQPPGQTGALCRDIAADLGLVMRAVGDSMIISPPLVMSRAQIDELVHLARAALDQTLSRTSG
jgi:putrescine aminotransferase